MFLISPSIWHRILFRQQDKEFLVVIANHFALAGLAFLGLAIYGAILLISHVVFASAATIVSSTAIGVLIIGRLVRRPADAPFSTSAARDERGARPARRLRSSISISASRGGPGLSSLRASRSSCQSIIRSSKLVPRRSAAVERCSSSSPTQSRMLARRSAV